MFPLSASCQQFYSSKQCCVPTSHADDSLPVVLFLYVKSICLSSHRGAFGSVGVSLRELGQSVESEGHPCHVWDGASQGSLFSSHPFFSPLSPFSLIKHPSFSLFNARPKNYKHTLCALLHLKCILFLLILLNALHLLKKSLKKGSFFLSLIQIRSQAQFQDMCQQHVRAEAEGTSKSGCCPSWSLGNYLAVLTNASGCRSLTSNQVMLCSSQKKYQRNKLPHDSSQGRAISI